MKIAVVEPCLDFKSNIVRDVIYGCWCGGKRIGGGTVPPFELLTIATILKNEGHDVVFIDAQAEQLDVNEVSARMKGSKLLIVSTSVMTVNSDAAYTNALKENSPDLLTAMYGSHPTFMPEDTLDKGIDFAIQREPEMVLKDLASALDNIDYEKARNTNGVVSKLEDGTVINNDRYPFLDNLDMLPPIDIDFLPKNAEYFNPIVIELPYITVSTSHGCPGKCNYCTAPFFHGARTRFQSAEKVLDDIGYYLSKGIKEIYYRDETFTADKQRVLDICKGIQNRGYKFPWICNARVDTVDREMLKAMKKAGCHLIKFGTESGNQEVLDAIKKEVTVEQNRLAIQMCNEIGIDSHAHLMLGMPGETYQSMEDTLNFALDTNPTTVTFGICTPYPGTPLFRRVVKEDPSIGDGADNAAMDRLHIEGDFNHIVSDVDGKILTKTVKRFYRKFYLRPSYIIRRLFGIRNWKIVRNLVIGGLNIFSSGYGSKS